MLWSAPLPVGACCECRNYRWKVVEIGNVSLGKEHEVSLAQGLITRKNLHVQGVVRYQPWYLH